MQRSNSLTEGSISRGLFQFTLPILCTIVLQTLNGFVNAIWVGHYLGEAALAAVSNANSVIFLLIGVASGVAMAATILVGQCIGAGNVTEAKRVIGTSSTFFAAVSVAIALAGMVFSEPLLVSMETPVDSLPLALAYMKVMLLALPSAYLYAVVMSLLRGVGDSKTPLYFMLLSVAIDILLNPALIFGVGPIPRAGIAGSALATLVAQTVSLTALVIHLYGRRHPLCLHKDELAMLRMDWSIVQTLVRKGIPMGVPMLLVSGSSVLMMVLVNRFGVDTAAAYGASTQLWTYILIPAAAIGMAVSAMAAQNVGAQKWDRVRSIAHVGVIYSTVLTSLTILVIYVLDANAYRLFLPAGSPALHIAAHINSVVAWSFVLSSISIVLFGVVRAAGAVMVPLFVDALSLLVVRLPLAAVLIDRWQADAIWWSFPISSALGVVLAALYYRYGGWRTVRQRMTISDTVESVRTPCATRPCATRAPGTTDSVFTTAEAEAFLAKPARGDREALTLDMQMPDLATNEGAELEVARWLIEIGQPVERGQALLEVETDRAMQEVECIADGTLKNIHVPAGKRVSVGTIIATIQVS